MKRKEWIALHETHLKTDPTTGKKKRVLTYVGAMYAVDPKQIRSLRVPLWSALAAAVFCFVLAGMMPARAGHQLYVLPFYALCALADFYVALSLWRVTHFKREITRVEQADGLERGKVSSTALLVLSVAWAVTALISLVVNGASSYVADGVFILCGAVSAVCGGKISGEMQHIHAVKTEQFQEDEGATVTNP